MPNSHPDESPVTWGRFNATIDALASRVSELETQNYGQFDRIRANEREVTLADENRRALASRVERLEADIEQGGEAEKARKDRRWGLIILILSGLVCPVVVTTVIAWLHIRALH